MTFNCFHSFATTRDFGQRIAQSSVVTLFSTRLASHISTALSIFALLANRTSTSPPSSSAILHSSQSIHPPALVSRTSHQPHLCLPRSLPPLQATTQIPRPEGLPVVLTVEHLEIGESIPLPLALIFHVSGPNLNLPTGLFGDANYGAPTLFLFAIYPSMTFFQRTKPFRLIFFLHVAKQDLSQSSIAKTNPNIPTLCNELVVCSY